MVNTECFAVHRTTESQSDTMENMSQKKQYWQYRQQKPKLWKTEMIRSEENHKYFLMIVSVFCVCA